MRLEPKHISLLSLRSKPNCSHLLNILSSCMESPGLSGGQQDPWKVHGGTEGRQKAPVTSRRLYRRKPNSNHVAWETPLTVQIEQEIPHPLGWTRSQRLLRQKCLSSYLSQSSWHSARVPEGKATCVCVPTMLLHCFMDTSKIISWAMLPCWVELIQ